MARSPGPGPLLLDDWTLIAEKYLEGRSIILNTDAWRVCFTRQSGCSGTPGRRLWHKPKYTELDSDSVVAEDGSVIKVFTGTQTIDGVWKHQRDGVCPSRGSRPEKIETL
eukprot:4352286-Amphidinium_carterae.1